MNGDDMNLVVLDRSLDWDGINGSHAQLDTWPYLNQPSWCDKRYLAIDQIWEEGSECRQNAAPLNKAAGIG